MPKRKITRRRRLARAIRRRTPKRLSILTMLGMGAGACVSFTPNYDGIAQSAWKVIHGEQKPEALAKNIIRETIGYDIEYKKWSLPALTTLTIAGAIGSKVVGKFVKPTTFDAIPYIGKRIKL